MDLRCFFNSAIYDQPIKVSYEQLSILLNLCKGMFAWREDENGNYYVKIWIKPFEK